MTIRAPDYRQGWGSEITTLQGLLNREVAAFRSDNLYVPLGHIIDDTYFTKHGVGWRFHSLPSAAACMSPDRGITAKMAWEIIQAWPENTYITVSYHGPDISTEEAGDKPVCIFYYSHIGVLHMIDQFDRIMMV